MVSPVFFRIDELLSMKLGDITLFTDRMSLFVPKRKNDQIREGHTSVIARSGKLTCPVAVTERLVFYHSLGILIVLGLDAL